MSGPPSTADRRGPTGLDRGAREAMLNVVTGLEDVTSKRLMRGLFHEHAYGGIDDYMQTVERVEGAAASERIMESMRSEIERHLDPTAINHERDRSEVTESWGRYGFLLAIPERDFLTAVEFVTKNSPDPFVRAGSVALTLERICKRRGIPYTMKGYPAEFVWTGDATTAEVVVEPALSTLDDPRLRGGPRSEFEHARAELRTGTPEAFKDAAGAACSAVESTMKVLLDEHRLPRPETQNAQPLFEELLKHGLVTREIEEIILAASRFGNRRGRHGDGPVVRPVAREEAEAVVQAAATAVTFLGKLLP